jgi:ribosome-associated protein
VLVDLGDIIVHLFSPDQRDYYQLEELWSNAKVVLKLK